MIVVMADGDGSSGHIAYQWNNAPNGANQIESAFLELVSYVDSHFRTIPDAAHRVIAGISSGGFGATNIAARHPSLFATVVSISGYFSLMGPVAGATPAYYAANSPAAILHTSPAARKLSYILIVGNNDPRFAQYSLTFAAELVQLGGRESLLFIPGGHSSHVWSLGLQLALKAVGRTPNLTA
jgi:enterochelin esterase family protein